jgi:peptidyl-tRNA hydrolase, PTH1 family
MVPGTTRERAMKLFVGLGNPGTKSAGHRHNVGFHAVERIADRHGFGAWRKKFSGLVTEGTLGGKKVMLLKPATYMNDSGQAVGEAARFLKLSESDVIVFHDELDLAPGKVRVKTGGGNAGHNGLRSISAHFGNDTQRVRIGIGHPGAKELVHHWVLGDFAKADRVWLGPLLDAIADAAPRLAAGDHERFMTDVARLTQSSDDAAPPAPREQKAEAPAKASTPHPAGERASKRQSALAENLKRWIKGTRRDEG